MTVKPGDETKTKEQLQKDFESREKLPEFNNLTYKDELELNRLGEEKMVLFLNIPLADRTYSCITAMLFSITFMLLYRKGKERMEKRAQTRLLVTVIQPFSWAVQILTH